MRALQKAQFKHLWAGDPAPDSLPQDTPLLHMCQIYAFPQTLVAPDPCPCCAHTLLVHSLNPSPWNNNWPLFLEGLTMS